MADMPEVGDIVDDVFQIESKLDEGGFGAIYLVEDLVEGGELALKVQKAGSENPEEVRARFEREARLLNGIEHDHIVELEYFAETDEGLPYMGMEFLVGTDLDRLLANGYDFDDEQIRRIARETLSALQAAHDVDVIHRDVKPGNIFIVDDGGNGHVKVLDFGFAKNIEQERARFVTAPGSTVGSPAYMAPELVREEDVGPHSDLYGLGLILAELIDGEPVVPVRRTGDIIRFQGSDDPVELPESVERSEFAPIVRKAVQKDVRARYGSAAQMLAEMEQLQSDGRETDLSGDPEVDRTTSAPFGEDAVVLDELSDPSDHPYYDENRSPDQEADNDRDETEAFAAESQWLPVATVVAASVVALVLLGAWVFV